MRPYLKYCFELTWRQRKEFLFLLFLVVLDTAARLIQPYLFKVVVDTLTAGISTSYFPQQQVQFLLSVIIVWFVLSVLNNIFNAESNYLVWQIGGKSSQWLHIEGYKRLLQLDYHKHTQKHSSQFAKIVDEGDTSMWEMTNWWLNRFLRSGIGFVAMLVVAFTVSWQMTLATLSVVPLGLSVIIFMVKRYEDEQHTVNKLWNVKHEHLSDQISNIITYKLNQNEKAFVEVQKGFSDRANAAQGALNKKWRLAEVLNPDVIARFLMMATGVLLVKDKVITLGTLFMFMSLLNEILVPLHLLGDILPQYSRRAKHIDRFLKLMDEKDEVVDPKKGYKPHRIEGRVEFKSISFKYPGETKLDTIKNISFVINPGEHIALVGHSGAGKSTIMGLLTRLMDPTSGVISLDGVDIRKFKQADYRHLIGTVLQEHSLYNETVAQNIAYGKPDASREEVIAASKKSAAHDFIQRLPNGYDTLIGERGVRLSGGEKQRLAIARAILKNPKIVILDEPTSALDSITEAKVQKGLETLIKGRTAITIAHRLSTVRNADKILVLRNGKILAMGSHSDLLRTCQEYKEMVELQTGGFLEDE